MFTSTTHWRVQRAIYRLTRVDPDVEQRWGTYAGGVLGFSPVGVLLPYLVQRVQPLLPWSFGHTAVLPNMAFATAVSFVTNTNRHSYVPEQTLGSAVPMPGLTVRNFVSAVVGIVVAVAARGSNRSATCGWTSPGP